jgi:hypothetical protein
MRGIDLTGMSAHYVQCLPSIPERPCNRTVSFADVTVRITLPIRGVLLPLSGITAIMKITHA